MYTIHYVHGLVEGSQGFVAEYWGWFSLFRGPTVIMEDIHHKLNHRRHHIVHQYNE